jgi:hypothetical protein
MSSKKRTLATNNNMNYNDYIKLKRGSEALKTAKYNNKNGVINKFTNYNEFQTLSAAYYKGLDLDKCELYPTKDLYNSNVSYVTNDSDDSCIDNTCKINKQILYPYGVYTSNKKAKIYFPYKLCLENWCPKKVICIDKCNDDCYENCSETCSDTCSDRCSSSSGSSCSSNSYLSNCCNKRCKTGLCKNARPLFI